MRNKNSGVKIVKYIIFYFINRNFDLLSSHLQEVHSSKNWELEQVNILQCKNQLFYIFSKFILGIHFQN